MVLLDVKYVSKYLGIKTVFHGNAMVFFRRALKDIKVSYYGITMVFGQIMVMP